MTITVADRHVRGLKVYEARDVDERTVRIRVATEAPTGLLALIREQLDRAEVAR